MKKLILLFVLLFSLPAFSQNTNENEVFEAVDKAANFEGGISSFRNEFAKMSTLIKYREKELFVQS